MQTHQLKSKTKRLTSQLVGRGGKRGKTAGRGTKGQKARAGHKIRPEIRDIIKRLPKLRGYSFKTIQVPTQGVTLEAVQQRFKANEVVSPRTLLEKNLIRQVRGTFPPVKILATGTLSKALIFEGCAMTATSKSIIEKAGGKVQ